MATEKVSLNEKDHVPSIILRGRGLFSSYNKGINIKQVFKMIPKQQSMNLSPLMAIYDLVVPKDNMLRKIKDLIDFSFVYEELNNKYCHDNGRNAIHPIRMFKYLLLKSIFDLSDVDVVERSQYDMSFKYFLDMAPGSRLT